MRQRFTVLGVAALAVLVLRLAAAMPSSGVLPPGPADAPAGASGPSAPAVPALIPAAIQPTHVANVSHLGVARPPPTGAVSSNHEPTNEHVSDEALTAVIQRVCLVCHNPHLETAGLSLEGFDVARAAERPEVVEKIITKLRLNMMPPPGIPRPGGDTLIVLVETLESKIDEAAAADRDPGARLLQRLTRAEYERTVRSLLGLEIDASAFLPPETISDNFDNLADVQTMSPALLEGYVRAAAHVARLAVGDPTASPVQITYGAPRTRSQLEQVEGAPYGSRGGIAVTHNFPADGEYVFNLELHREVEDFLFGRTARGERLELSINGDRVALIEIDRWMSERDPHGLVVSTDPIFVRAGPHKVAAVFVPTREGPVNDLLAPIEHTMADPWIGRDLGITTVPHLRDLQIVGPHNATGVSQTPSRTRIFTCRPTAPDEEGPCAEAIIRRLGQEAYRRPLTRGDVERLMPLYEHGAEDGGFEGGIRTALQGILSSPNFVFRFNTQPVGIRAGEIYAIDAMALASWLSYFLWAEPPDAELIAIAAEDRLHDPQVLERQVRRMLADPRSMTLGTRFAAQWLRLPRLNVIHPDPRRYPEFDDRLRDAMRRETELFFHSLLQDDRSFLELFDSDYTFVNERLARHYGIPGVVGNEFRRVRIADERRRGLFGHASVLTLTSHANRTSPVDRGVWIMEVLLGTEPPPPPPNVPDLDVTASVDPVQGRALTVRERMEMHRTNPTCNACHQFIDPLGLPLENWDATGLWRTRDGGNPLDSRGELWDGTIVETPQDLRAALLTMETALVRNFTENLMRYALGRRVQSHDKPVIRQIARDAADNDYRVSAFILGIVLSEPFRMRRAEQVVDEEPDNELSGQETPF